MRPRPSRSQHRERHPTGRVNIPGGTEHRDRAAARHACRPAHDNGGAPGRACRRPHPRRRAESQRRRPRVSCSLAGPVPIRRSLGRHRPAPAPPSSLRPYSHVNQCGHDDPSSRRSAPGGRMRGGAAALGRRPAAATTTTDPNRAAAARAARMPRRCDVFLTHLVPRPGVRCPGRTVAKRGPWPVAPAGLRPVSERLDSARPARPSSDTQHSPHVPFVHNASRALGMAVSVNSIPGTSYGLRPRRAGAASPQRIAPTRCWRVRITLGGRPVSSNRAAAAGNGDLRPQPAGDTAPVAAGP